jgi:hypothetical protein
MVALLMPGVPRGWWALALILLVAVLTPVSVTAQGLQEREGLWAQVGIGAGFNRTDCTNCDTEQWAEGGVVYLRAGTTISKYVLLGLEAYGFRKTSGESSESKVQGLVAMAQWYPWLKHGGYLKVGWGLSHGEGRFTASNISSQGKRTGMAVTVGVGWDIRVARNISITPVFNSYINALGDIAFPGVGTIDDALTTLYVVGVGVTFH